MRLIVSGETEACTKEGTEELDLVDVGLELSINGILQSLLLRADSLNRLLSGEKSLLTLDLLLLLASEEGIINLGDIDAIKGDLGGGGDDILLVDTAERNTVDTIRTY